ncbi:conserved hypothetical protein [Xanthomonas citri pv. fuscans]|nr:conserved hypothetical protein [Xanthomonas citri pv. fuscans]SOO33897.1 conserved hypothetical protein [Xanthomonas citri pv. fuscans]
MRRPTHEYGEPLECERPHHLLRRSPPEQGLPMHGRIWGAFGCVRASLTPSGHPSRETTSHGKSRDILISRYYTPFHHFPSQGKIQCHLWQISNPASRPSSPFRC